jgi:hypothetical protein
MNSVYIDSAVAASPIYIGPTNANSVIVGNTNSTTSLVGSVNIQNEPTAGNVNIKSGTTASGSINIANSTGSVVTNIGAGTGTGIITIGNPANGTNINSGTVNITRNIAGTAPTYIEMYSTNTVNSIEFHSSGTNDVDYDSRITTYGGTSTAGNGTMDILAGLVNMRSTNIAYNTAGTVPTYIEMLSDTNNNTIDFHSSGLNQVNFDTRIRATGGTSTEGNGALVISTSSLNINAITSTGIQNFAGASVDIGIGNFPGTALLPTSGVINIASGTNAVPNSFTTAVNIGAGSTTGAITIGNVSNTTNMRSSIINLQNFAGTTTGNVVDVDIGNTPGTTLALATSGAINLASGTNAIPNSYTTAVNIGSGSTTGAITIGNVSNTTNLNSGKINVVGDLTMGTGKNITLQPASSYVEPTANTMLGGITVGTFSALSASINGTTTIASLTLTKGTYIVYVNFEVAYTGTFTTNYITFDSTGTVAPRPSTFEVGASQIITTTPTTQITFCGSVAVSFTTAGTLILKYNLAGATVSALNNRNYYAVRIA